LFQIFTKIETLRHINEEQLSMVQQKLLKRNLEIEKHEEHLRVMNV